MRRRLRVLTIAAGAAGVLAVAGPPPSLLVHPVGRLTDASVDAAVATVAAALAWVCVCWVGTAVLVSAAAHIPGACGHASARISAAITPAVVRRTVEAAVGLTVAAVPVMTPVLGQAHADSGQARSELPLPSLDRPAGEVPPPVHLPAGAPPPHLTKLSVYVVRQGDCLWTIAARHIGAPASVDAVAATWPRLYAANRAVIGANPNVLRPGQRLVVPKELA